MYYYLCILFAGSGYKEEWLEGCLQFTDGIEPSGGDCAYFDLSGHPDPSEIAARLAEFLSDASGRPVRYGAAGSKWIARLAAEWEDDGLALSDPAAFLAPLPVECLRPIAPENIVRLRFLGYRTIGEAVSIPLEVLWRQFDEEGYRIYRAARGFFADPVRALFPPESIIERFRFDGCVSNWADVEGALRLLADRLGKRLADRDRQGQRMVIVLETGGAPSRLERMFARPIATPSAAFAAMTLMVKNAFDDTIVNEKTKNKNFIDDRIVKSTPNDATGLLTESQVPPGSPDRTNDGRSGDLKNGCDSVGRPVASIESHCEGAIRAIRILMPGLEKTDRAQPNLLESVPERRRRLMMERIIRTFRSRYGDRSIRPAREVPVPRRLQILREWQRG